MQVSPAVHTFTILHISDLHDRGARETERWRRQTVLGETWLSNLDELHRSNPIDLVCFTGDLTNSGQTGEYDQAASFLGATLRQLGLPKDRLFLVPGNHDIDRMSGTNSHASWKRLRNRLSSMDELAISRLMIDSNTSNPLSKWRDLALSRQNAYRKFLRTFGRESLLPENSAHGRLGYHAIVNLPHLPFPVNIIGLDSSWLSGDSNDAGKLRLTDDQIVRLCGDDNGGIRTGFNLALIHHPLTDLADFASSRRHLAKYVQLLLRGHLHEPEPELWNGPEQRLLQITTGSLYEGHRANAWPNSCISITVSCNDAGTPIQYDLRFRGYSTSGQHWFDNSGLYKSAPHGSMSLTTSATATPTATPTPTPTVQSDSSTVLFDAYTVDAEPYYIRRAIDHDIAQVVSNKSIWLHGNSGTGKTCAIHRLIKKRHCRIVYITLSALCTGMAKDCIIHIHDQIVEALNMSGKSPTSSPKAIEAIRRILNSLSGDTWIYIDEISLSEPAQLSIFTNSIVSLLGSSPIASSSFRILISSIYGPGEHIEDSRQRVYERMKIVHCDIWKKEDIKHLADLIDKKLGLSLADNEISEIVDAAKGIPRFIKQFFRNKITYTDLDFSTILNRTINELMSHQR